MNIAVVTHGRFEVFYLALALIERGHDVKVLINYPKWAAEKFGMKRDHVQCHMWHGIISRLLGRWPFFEPMMHRWFGKWAAKQLKKRQWDIILGMSGISKEFLEEPQLKAAMNVVIRASAHIRTQYSILAEEEKRAGAPFNKPSQWMIDREEAEYALADKIRVLSRFSYDSFLFRGIQPDKLWLNPSAFPLEQFQAMPAIISQRCERILKGGPLRVLYVGNLSLQKGMIDLKKIIKLLENEGYEFYLVGKQLPEISCLFVDCSHNVVLHGKKKQQELMAFYEWADLFVYPTLQDGFPQVLAQAYAGGLPILATTNSSAPDFIEDGKTGWIFPIRSSGQFVEKLRWCDRNRAALAKMVISIEQSFSSAKVRTWADAAKETEAIMDKACR